MNPFFIINKNSSILQALEQIEKNNEGGVVLIDDNDFLVGIVTDGDIRRHLLSGNLISDNILLCAKIDCIFEYHDTSRDILLKKLDGKIRILPILNREKKVIDVITKNSIPNIIESRMYARSRAPVRVSFGGGGSDLTHFFLDNKGAVVNSTISLYTHATLIIRDDPKVLIDSTDLNLRIEFVSLNKLMEYDGKLGLIQSVLKKINPSYGFELYLNSDFPMSSGLGGSAAVAASILGCFNEFRFDKWDKHELSELAFEAERFIMGISGGWQDQYATVFGGFNFMEFDKSENIVHPLRISEGVILELEESFVLCDTGSLHNSGSIHDSQKETMKSENVKEKVKQNVELTYEMRNCLLKGKLIALGPLLDNAWKLKKGFSTQISNNQLDNIYNFAIENGATGGKLLGAGGGGFFLFYTPPQFKNNLIGKLREKGLKIHPFKFEQNGLVSWKSRHENIYK